MNFQEVRASYPQYNDLSDEQLATALHSRYYSDMSFDDFSQRIGYGVNDSSVVTQSMIDEIPDGPSDVSEFYTGSEYPSHIQEFVDMPIGQHDAYASARQGATLGWGDEIDSAMRGAYDTIMGRGWTYRDWQDAKQERRDAFKEDSPWISSGMEVAGSVPTALALPAVKGWDSANKMRSMARLGMEGAAYGGIYGAGTSEESLLDNPMSVAKDAGKDAAIGAVTSPLVGASLSGLGSVFKRDAESIATNEGFGLGSTLAERFPTIGKIQDVLDYTTGGAFAANQRAAGYKDEAIDNIKNLMPDGKGDAQSIGNRFIEVKDDWINQNSNEFKAAFQQVRENLDLSGSITPSNTNKFLSSERDSFSSDAIADIVEIPSVKRLRKAISDGEDISVETLWKLRTELGDSITTGKFGVDDISQAKAKQLYGAISDDLYDGVMKHSNEDNALFFMELNEDYKLFQQALDDLRPLFAKSSKDQHSPEEVVRQLTKRLRDEPSTLEPLQYILAQRGQSLLDEAGAGVLAHTASNTDVLNRATPSEAITDPFQALKRYYLSRNKTGHAEPSTNPVEAVKNLTSTSPARNLAGGEGVSYQYERAMRSAQRAQNAAERGGAIEAKQLVMSGAVPALAGFAMGGPLGSVLTPLATNAITYGLRRGMSNEAASAFADKVIRGIQDGTITADQLRMLNTVIAADNEAFSEL
ncbi:hypothetical protein CGI18_07240 [Vibrio parahaemolyticus]|uniref:hypothetical protein n=1 Tax=Vibrio parahaemolyticus TaxID=670 RepID=UPI001122CDB3|nr:hypothetical protein [Vibrio parahaemolyticus]TOK48279.1 hypothetical protein CGI18_07240 [Vibrio parahaemolyticus]